MFKSDLHCHSVCSDGTYTPKELLLHAKERGLQGLSITDHDTVLAYGEAVPAAKEIGIALISGAEFSSEHQGQTVHVLAYSFPLDHPKIQEFCLMHDERRRERNLQILEKLGKKGLLITEEELLSAAGNIGTIGRPHIAKALVDKGYVSNFSEAFKNFIADGQCCYVKGRYPSTEETLEVIHEAKGIAVLAHPHLLKNEPVFRSLRELPFDGIEAYYAYFPPEAEKRWIKVAHEKQWLITGGSDFHGTITPKNWLGCSWTPQETFDILRAHFERNS